MKPSIKLLTEWIITLCVALLFSSAINGLFQALAYGKTFDIAVFILSLALALVAYFGSMDPKKNPIVKKRLIVAVCSIIVWALSMPVVAVFCR